MRKLIRSSFHDVDINYASSQNTLSPHPDGRCYHLFQRFMVNKTKTKNLGITGLVYRKTIPIIFSHTVKSGNIYILARPQCQRICTKAALASKMFPLIYIVLNDNRLTIKCDIQSFYGIIMCYLFQSVAFVTIDLGQQYNVKVIKLWGREPDYRECFSTSRLTQNLIILIIV